jgi:hypothetical protein
MKYKALYILSYATYGLSFLIPAYFQDSIWYGWKCCAVVYALIFFADHIVLAVLLLLPNVSMILLLFLHKRINLVFLFVILLFNFSSCSFWWIIAITDGKLESLLPGYWLWLLSIVGNNVVLLLNKTKKG